MTRHRTCRWIGGLLAVAALGSATDVVQAGQPGSPLTIGTLRRVHSSILNEHRPLSIRVPSDYGQTRLSYPVIYLLYGDQTEGYFAETIFALERLAGGAEMPDCIVVGVHNTDRYGNLLPVHFAGRPSGADAFLEFLDKELFPFIEAEFRTKPYRLLVGPQAGGPFGLYALARRPALLKAFILENPFSAPDSRNVLRAGLRDYAVKHPEAKAVVAINAFDRTGFQDHAAANQALAEFLKELDPNRPSGVRMWRRQVEEPTFVPSLELKQPLRQIFEGFYPPAGAKLGGLADILTYYRDASRRFGFDVDPPAFLLAVKADDLSRAGRAEAAREVLEYSLSLRPEETNAAFRLGNLLVEAGNLDRAEAIFRALQARRPDPYFKQRLEAIDRMRNHSAAYALSKALEDGLAAARTRLADLETATDAGVYFEEQQTQLARLQAPQPRPDRSGRVHPRAERAAVSRFMERSRQPGRSLRGRPAAPLAPFEGYERSRQLNPNNANARKMLEALRR
jgi:enterochelin esterase-like enzyme